MISLIKSIITFKYAVIKMKNVHINNVEQKNMKKLLTKRFFSCIILFSDRVA